MSGCFPPAPCRGDRRSNREDRATATAAIGCSWLDSSIRHRQLPGGQRGADGEVQGLQTRRRRAQRCDGETASGPREAPSRSPELSNAIGAPAFRKIESGEGPDGATPQGCEQNRTNHREQIPRNSKTQGKHGQVPYDKKYGSADRTESCPGYWRPVSHQSGHSKETQSRSAPCDAARPHHGFQYRVPTETQKQRLVRPVSLMTLQRHRHDQHHRKQNLRRPWREARHAQQSLDEERQQGKTEIFHCP